MNRIGNLINNKLTKKCELAGNIPVPAMKKIVPRAKICTCHIFWTCDGCSIGHSARAILILELISFCECIKNDAEHDTYFFASTKRLVSR